MSKLLIHAASLAGYCMSAHAIIEMVKTYEEVRILPWLEELVKAAEHMLMVLDEEIEEQSSKGVGL